MNKLKQCESCGADTEYRIEGSTEGFFCKKCDWALVTTRIPEIAQDITKYKLYLISANPNNKKQIKTISKFASINFLQAKKISERGGDLIVQDEAVKIDKAIKAFDNVSIKYKVEPEFSY